MLCLLLQEPLPDENILKRELQRGIDGHFGTGRVQDFNYKYWRSTADKKFKRLIDRVPLA